MVNKRLVFYALKLWGGCHISVVRGHQHITVQQIPPEFAQEIRDTVLSSCLGHHLYVYLAPLYPVCVYMLSCFSRSDSLQPHGLQPTRLLHPLDSPGKNTGVGCHAFLQGLFPAQGWNRDLPNCRRILYRLRHQGEVSRGRLDGAASIMESLGR